MDPRTSVNHSLRQAPEVGVRAEQIRLLYGSSVVLFINLVNAPITAALLWQIYPGWIWFGWIGLVIVAIAARVILSRRFRRQQPTDQDAERWGRSFTLGSFATGCLWGLLASVVFVTENPAYYVFVAFVLGGMTAGAAVRSSAYLPAFYAFAAPTVLPMIVALLAKGTFMLGGMGLLLSAFAAVLVLVARDNNRRISENIRMGIEQSILNDNLQRVTAELKQEVADREQAAIALAESNARLRAIGDNALDAMIIADANNNVIYWNPAAERIFGFTPDEIMGRSVHTVLAPERYRQKAMEGFKRFAATGRGEVLGKTVQLEAFRKDGSEFPIDLSVSAMRVGGAWHALGIARDVSDRKQAETLLRAREADLKEAQRVAHVGDWAWLPEANTTQWSEELYRIFGRDPSLPAPSVQEHAQFMAPESFARMKAAMAACADTGAPYEIDLEFMRPGGAIGWITARGESHRDADGRTTRIRGTAQDITARRLAEQKIRDDEATLRGLVEQGMSGILVVSEDGTIVYLNPRLAEMLGYRVATDVVGRPVLDLVPDADKPLVAEAMETLLSKKQSSVEVAMSARHQQGGTISILAQATLTTFRGKRAILTVVLDITERKQSEEKIAKLHEQMKATVAMLRRHERDMMAVAKLSDMLQSCHTRTEAYPIVAATGNELFDGTSGALALVVSGTHELKTVAQWGAEQTSLRQFSSDDCWALRIGQRYDVNGPGTGIICRHLTSAPRGPYVCLPLTVHGETTGLLHLSVAADGVVDEELHRQMLSFGDVVKLSLSNLKLRETLSEQAMRDHLTGLFNRHYLAETLPREILRAQRNDTPLSVAMLDIDHFKRFNDEYGHDAGDVVLRELGALLREALRADDVACRYGGEEFLLVLPECDASTAQARLRQICLEIKGKTFLFQQQVLPSVTMSAGLSQLGPDLASPDALIAAADEALYTAKHNGRDRVEMFSSEPRQTAAKPAA